MIQIDRVPRYRVPEVYHSLVTAKALDVEDVTNMVVHVSNLIVNAWQSIHSLAPLLVSHPTPASNLIDGVVITHQNEDNLWAHLHHPPPHHQVLPSKCKCCIVKKIINIIVFLLLNPYFSFSIINTMYKRW